MVFIYVFFYSNCNQFLYRICVGFEDAQGRFPVSYGTKQEVTTGIIQAKIYKEHSSAFRTASFDVDSRKREGNL